MKHAQLLRQVILLTLLGMSVITGCTHTINPPQDAFTGYTPQDKIQLKVGLNVTEELRRAKWEKNMMGDTWIIPIGESLTRNSAILARHVFAEVVDVSGSTPGRRASLDAILTPKLAYINRTMGATSFGESIIAVKMEWDLSTQDDKPVWVETVSGEASGSTGWTDPEKVLKQALETLLRKSQEAMTSSEAIRRFAASR
jgi:hypothetical protein